MKNGQNVHKEKSSPYLSVDLKVPKRSIANSTPIWPWSVWVSGGKSKSCSLNFSFFSLSQKSFTEVERYFFFCTLGFSSFTFFCLSPSCISLCTPFCLLKFFSHRPTFFPSLPSSPRHGLTFYSLSSCTEKKKGPEKTFTREEFCLFLFFSLAF